MTSFCRVVRSEAAERVEDKGVFEERKGYKCGIMIST